MTEEWRDIPGHENCYQVSNFGNVRSVDREYVYATRWGGTTIKKYRSRSVRANKDTNGYLSVQLGSRGGRKRIHRLVALTFLEGGGEGLDVNHRDSNRENNNLTNLEWCSRSENIQHCVSAGRHRWQLIRKTANEHQ